MSQKTLKIMRSQLRAVVNSAVNKAIDEYFDHAEIVLKPKQPKSTPPTDEPAETQDQDRGSTTVLTDSAAAPISIDTEHQQLAEPELQTFFRSMGEK